MPHNSISSFHSRYASTTPHTGTCCCAFRVMLLCFYVMRAFRTLLGFNDIEVLATLSKIPQSNGSESHCKCEHGPSKTAAFVSDRSYKGLIPDLHCRVIGRANFLRSLLCNRHHSFLCCLRFLLDALGNWINLLLFRRRLWGSNWSSGPIV